MMAKSTFYGYLKIIFLCSSILNYGCHFYCIDSKSTKKFESFLEASKVVYVISKNFSNLKGVCSIIHKGFDVLSDRYFIGETKEIVQSENIKNMNLCYTVSTSGTTGEPKMVHVPYKCIYPNIKSIWYVYCC